MLRVCRGLSLFYLLCNSLARSFGEQTLQLADPKLPDPLLIDFVTRSFIQPKPFPLSETSSLDRDLIKMPLTTFYKWEVRLFAPSKLASLLALLTRMIRKTITDLVSDRAFTYYGETGSGQYSLHFRSQMWHLLDGVVKSPSEENLSWVS